MEARINQMKVLAVGGDGFIGRYLSSDYEVMDLKLGYDVRDGIEKRYSTIIFLACNFEQSVYGYVDNVLMLSSLNDYMKICPDTHIIFTSSAAVYGSNKSPRKETDRLKPFLWYGEVKAYMEQIISRYKRHTILRLSNVYGNGDGNGIIDLFKSGNRVIYGDGEQTRDFIPVQAVSKTITSAIRNPKKWQGTFNVASGHSMSVNNAFALYGEGKPAYKKDKRTEIEHSTIDNTKWVNNWK